MFVYLCVCVFMCVGVRQRELVCGMIVSVVSAGNEVWVVRCTSPPTLRCGVWVMKWTHDALQHALQHHV